ncbi:MAG: hypothetical protein MUE62_09650, partial [Burkholderiaceae bacterium]|nr:hypothetical protein [Burkholderiaceae bacterium]
MRPLLYLITRLSLAGIAAAGGGALANGPSTGTGAGTDETALVRSYRAEAQAYEHGEGVPRDGA